jgi:pyruvate dehydrogenase E2 component (dihydrolipoamide acetyltransferase)
MQSTKQLVPHFRVVLDIEIDAAMELRRRLNSANSNARISLNDVIVKATASALMAVPEVNIQFSEEGIRHFADADIALITAIEGGLATPIIRSANQKPLPIIAAEARALIERSRQRALKASEVEGGTFTVSNLGMFGIDSFDAIINAPQCAILAVGAAKARFRVSNDGSPRIATIVRTTLSVDHRAIDGAVAAAFLNALREQLERPEQLASMSA